MSKWKTFSKKTEMLHLTSTHLKQRTQSIVNYDRNCGHIKFSRSKTDNLGTSKAFIPLNIYLKRDCSGY